MAAQRGGRGAPHKKWQLPATLVWSFATGGRLIIGGWEHAMSRIRELEPCARPTPQGSLESNPSCLGAYFRTTRRAKICARPTFKAQRNSFQTPLGRTVVHGSMSARLDGIADEVINCAHEDGPWPDDSERQRRDCGPDPMLRETGRDACRLVKFGTLGAKVPSELASLQASRSRFRAAEATPQGAGCTSGSGAPSRPLTVCRLAGRGA